MALSEASVDVEADFSTFDTQLRRALDRAIVQASRRGRAAGTAFGRAFARAATAQITGIFSRTQFTAAARALGTASGRVFRDAFRDAARDITIDIDLREPGRRAGTQLREAIDTAASRNTLRRTLNGINQALSVLGRGVRFTALAGGLALIAGAAAQALVTVTQLSLAVGNSLVPALSAVGSVALSAGIALGALGSAAIVAAVITMNALSLGLRGVSDALEASLEGDVDAFTKALEKLAPAAREFVTIINEAEFGLKDLQQAIQQATFEPLIRSAGQIAAVLPRVRTLLEGVAGALGRLIAEFVNVATSAVILDRLQMIANRLEVAFDRLRAAVGPLVNAFTQLADLGAAAFGPLADHIVRAALAFERWVTAGIESGRFMIQLQQTADDLRAAFAALVEFGRDLGTIFGSLADAARAAGIDSAGLFGVIGQGVSSIAEFVSSAEGMRLLTEVFAAINRTAQALRPALIAVLSLFRPLANIVAALAESIGPGLTAGLEALGRGLDALVVAAEPVGRALGGALEAIGLALEGIALIAAPLLQILGEGLAAAFVALNPILRVFVQIVRDVSEVVSAFFGSEEVRRLVAEGTQLLADFAQQVADAFAEIGPALAEVARAFLSGLLPILTQVRATLIESGLIDAVVELARAFGQLLVSNLRALAPVITQVFGLLASTVQQFVVPNLRTFFDVLTQVINQITLILSDPRTSQAFAAVIQSWGEAFTDLLAAITPLLPELQELWITIGQQLAEALIRVGPLLPGLVSSFIEMLAAVIPLIPSLLSLASRFLTLILEGDRLERILGLVTTAIRLFAAVAPAMIVVLQSLITVVTIAANVLDRFLGVVDRVVGGVRRLIDAWRNLLSLPRRLDFSVAVSAIGSGLRNLFPGFKAGGITDREMLAHLHPREAIMPLDNPARTAQVAEEAGLLDVLARSRAGRDLLAREPGTVADTRPQVNNFLVRVFLGTRELEQIVRVEAESILSDNADELAFGTR